MPHFHKSSLYIGPHLRLNYLTYLEEQYYVKWNQTQHSIRNFEDEKGLAYFNIGLNLGTKFVFHSHFVIEISIIPSVLIETPIGKLNKIDYGSQLFLFSKIGYRFNRRSKKSILNEEM